MRKHLSIIIFSVIFISSFYQFFGVKGHSFYPRIKYPAFNRISKKKQDLLISRKFNYEFTVRTTSGPEIKSSRVDKIFYFIGGKESFFFHKIKKIEKELSFRDVLLMLQPAILKNEDIIEIILDKLTIDIPSGEIVETESIKFR